MERLAAEGIRSERDAAVKAALKAKVPWPDVLEAYGLTLQEIMAIAAKMDGLPARKDDLRDARDEPKIGRR